MKIAVILALSAVLSYVLYIKVYGVINSKIAVAFIGRRSHSSRGASVTACTGFTRSVMPLETGRKYRLTMDCNITDGDITVEIIKGRKLILVLDRNHPEGIIDTEKGVYTITTKFMKASGDYDVRWE